MKRQARWAASACRWKSGKSPGLSPHLQGQRQQRRAQPQGMILLTITTTLPVAWALIENKVNGEEAGGTTSKCFIRPFGGSKKVNIKIQTSRPDKFNIMSCTSSHSRRGLFFIQEAALSHKVPLNKKHSSRQPLILSYIDKNPNYIWTWTFFWHAYLPQILNSHLLWLQLSALRSEILSQPSLMHSGTTQFFAQEQSFSPNLVLPWSLSS